MATIPRSNPRAERAFCSYATAFLAYNVLVIVWGALVRATGSGAGCGNHWPLCNGEWMPLHPGLHTIIELTHRGMSGLALIGAVAAWLWSRKLFAPKSWARRGAGLALLFMVLEAVIGAGLVLLKLVAQDTSLLRAGYLSVHLLNTFLLIAALTLMAWAARRPEVIFQTQERRPWPALLAALLGTLIVGISGGIAALGDTLFPAASLKTGLAMDFAAGSHFLLRLRAFHPLLAILLAVDLIWLAFREGNKKAEAMRRAATGLLITVLCQLILGAWNLTWLAPVYLQLAHLLMADLLWIALLLFVLERAALAGSTPAV